MDKLPTPRIITVEELKEEGRQRTIVCDGCMERIRYVAADVVTDKPGDRRFVPCPGCAHERVIAIGGIRDR